MSDLQANQNWWPELKWPEWQKTASTLHMWTQIVGKTRLAPTPLRPHWWNVPLYVTARGLSTSAMPYGPELLDIEFDFVSHDLRFRLSSGAMLSIPLRAQSVADFFEEYQRSLRALGVSVRMHSVPVEVKSPFPLPKITSTLRTIPMPSTASGEFLSNRIRSFSSSRLVLLARLVLSTSSGAVSILP